MAVSVRMMIVSGLNSLIVSAVVVVVVVSFTAVCARVTLAVLSIILRSAAPVRLRLRCLFLIQSNRECFGAWPYRVFLFCALTGHAPISGSKLPQRSRFGAELVVPADWRFRSVNAFVLFWDAKGKGRASIHKAFRPDPAAVVLRLRAALGLRFGGKFDQGALQSFDVDGFGEMPRKTGSVRLPDVGVIPGAADGDPSDPVTLTQLAHQLVAATIREGEVADEAVESLRCKRRPRLRAGARGDDGVASAAE